MNDYDGETDDRGTEVPEVGGFPFVITFYPRFEATNRPLRLQMARSAHYAALGRHNGRFALFAASEAASRPQIDIKWYYEGSTSDLGDLGPSVVGFPIVILHYLQNGPKTTHAQV